MWQCLVTNSETEINCSKFTIYGRIRYIHSGKLSIFATEFVLIYSPAVIITQFNYFVCPFLGMIGCWVGWWKSTQNFMLWLKSIEQDKQLCVAHTREIQSNESTEQTIKKRWKINLKLMSSWIKLCHDLFKFDEFNSIWRHCAPTTKALRAFGLPKISTNLNVIFKIRWNLAFLARKHFISFHI